MGAHADDHTQHGTAVKRRGLIAGAAALATALIASRAPQPVTAASGGGDQGPLVLGSNNLYKVSGGNNVANVSSVATVVEASPNFQNYAYAAGHYVFKVDAIPAGSGAGLDAIQAYATDGIALYGKSDGSHAVFGNLNGPIGSGYAGVYGSGSKNGTYGVYGFNLGTGIGVQGQNDAAGGTGVKGISYYGFPIIGNVTGIANNAAGVVGAGTVGPGVQGQSLAGHGLVGTTDAPDGHAGLIGNATHTGGIGLMGIAPNYGTQTVGHAGEFYGNVKIYGGGLVAPVVQASVKHQGDGSYRALHTLATPEGWIEDFGEASFANNNAQITLDHDFAALIESGYQVYLTEYDDHHSLYVTNRSASGFVVQAKEVVTASGVKAPTKGLSGRFGYRVVGKRRDVGGERLAKVAAPIAPKIPTAFTIPEMPEVKAPDKKP